MIRMLAPIALLLAPVPALADVTAVYSSPDMEFTVRADAAGTACLKIDRTAGLYRIAGVDYIALIGMDQALHVTALEPLALDPAACALPAPAVSTDDFVKATNPKAFPGTPGS